MTDNHPNFLPMLEIEALIEQIKWGKLDVSTELHNGQIKGVSVYGEKKLLFNKSADDVHDNDDALITILNRIRAAIEAKESSELEFNVKVVGPCVKAVSWKSRTTKRY